MKTFFLLSIVLLSICSRQIESNLPDETEVGQNSTIQTETENSKANNFVIADSTTLIIKSSILLEQLEKKKAENPQIPAKEFAAFANELIPKYGVNFWVDLADLIEKKTKSKETQEVDNFNVRFNFLLTLNDSTEKIFQIDSPTAYCCCDYAYADFPVSNITAKQMTIIIDGKPYKIERTKDISFSQEHILIDDKTKAKKIRSWQVPFETYPDGISEDGTKLYIDYENTGLFLEISENGNIRFFPKNAPKIITNGQDLRRFPEPKFGEILQKSGGEGLILFKSKNKIKSKNKNYIINFPYPCT